MDFHMDWLVLHHHLVHILHHRFPVFSNGFHILVLDRRYSFPLVPVLIILYLIGIDLNRNGFGAHIALRGILFHQDITSGAQHLGQLNITDTLLLIHQAAVLLLCLPIPDRAVCFKYPNLRPGFIAHDNLLRLIIKRHPGFIKHDIPGSFHSAGSSTAHITLCGIDFKQRAVVQDVFARFTVQFFNADSGTVKLIFKIHVGKTDKIKGTVMLQSRLPVSNIPVVINDFPVPGV